MSETKTLADGLQEELARARTIQGYAREIGPAGAFMVVMIEQDIKAAERAMLESDVVGMIQAYQTLKEIKEWPCTLAPPRTAVAPCGCASPLGRCCCCGECRGPRGGREEGVMKVYGICLNGRDRTIVAANTKKQAIDALGVSLYYFNGWAAETGNDEEIAIATSNPGVAFTRHINAREGTQWERFAKR